MYARGRGVPKDHAEALKWFRMAAEQGHAKAQFNLGVMYARGRGVPKDGAEAVKWYRMAAEQGDARGQYNLGIKYARGRGAPKDDLRAYAWYNLAAEQGFEHAVKARKRLRERMTPKQIERAQELSNTFSQRMREKADLRTD